MAECGFDKDAAVVAAGALAEEVNKRFGDSVSKTACVIAVKKFIASGVDLCCRSCGWRKPKTRFCTQRRSDTSDADTCEEFRHLFNVVHERK